MNRTRLSLFVALLAALATCLALAACSPQSSTTSASASHDEELMEANDRELGSVPLEEGRITMTLCGSADTYVRLGESYVESGCLVRDREEGSLSDRVQVSGDVDASQAGDYTVTYTVQNDAGMVNTTERTVHVVDNLEWDDDGIPVMMYHYVYDPADPPDDVNGNYIATDDLEAQLAWLTEEHFYYPSWAELRAYVDGTHSLPAKSIVMSFDDGEYGFLDHGIPLLEKYQVNATSFTECSREDIERMLTAYASPYVMFESHTYDLHHAGGSGRGHGGAIYDFDVAGLVDDFQHACDILGSKGALAYPFGDVSEEASKAIDEVGILCAFTVEYDQVHVGDDHTALPRVRVQGQASLDAFKSSVL